VTVHLVQLLLPLRDNHGVAHDAKLFTEVASTLAERFGGITAYTRSPAEGLWQSGGDTHHDDVVAVEVMVDDLDEEWWRDFRQHLEIVFRQRQLLVLAHEVRRL
jgi:hypothetical protein